VLAIDQQGSIGMGMRIYEAWGDDMA